jgi:urease accessory protein
MLHLVHAPVSSPDLALPESAIPVDRRDLSRRRWRLSTEDGHDFGFVLARSLQHGDTIAEVDGRRYVLSQRPEPVLSVPLRLAASAAAGLGWAFGNLHLEASADAERFAVADTPAARQLLARLGLPFTSTEEVFRPGRFARGALPAHELGPSHQH